MLNLLNQYMSLRKYFIMKYLGTVGCFRERIQRGPTCFLFALENETKTTLHSQQSPCDLRRMLFYQQKLNVLFFFFYLSLIKCMSRKCILSTILFLLAKLYMYVCQQIYVMNMTCFQYFIFCTLSNIKFDIKEKHRKSN